MATRAKGIVLEIDGDMTGFNKALSDAGKTSKQFSGELREVEKLLKFDPTNTVLLAQKQKILSDSIAATSSKLVSLKEAQARYQDQAERGEISEQQFRRLEREIISTETQLRNLESSQREMNTTVAALPVDRYAQFGTDLQSLGNSANSAGEKMKGVSLAAAGLLTGLVANSVATKDYREEMAKLETAFTTAGHTTEEATQVYTDFYALLGESDRAVETVGHLAQLTTTQKELTDWTTIATGVYATFGDSLPIEGLTEAANETAKTGELTGVLADALNWAGVSEDSFKAKLEKVNNEQDRQKLIAETLTGLYGEAAEKYREVNGELLKTNEIQASVTDSMARLAEVMQPIINDVMGAFAEVLSGVIDWIETLDQSTVEFILVVVALVAAIAPLLMMIGQMSLGVAALMPLFATLGPIIAGLAAPIGVAVGAIMVIIGVMGLWSEHSDAIKAKITEVMNSIKTAFTGAADKIKTIVADIIQAGKDMVSSWIQTGKDLITGLWDGMKEKISELMQKVKDFGTDLANAVKSAVGFGTTDLNANITSSTSKGRASSGTNISIGTMQVREEADIRKVANELDTRGRRTSRMGVVG